MLNENLSRLRKERGLTQEALAVKLNVVRQTISKWENGTAVPDADTLCKIADVLEVSVADLLGEPKHQESTDMSALAKSLAEINEQLAVRNRRSNNIVKIIVGIIIGLLLLAVILIAMNIFVREPVIENKDSIVKVESSDEAGGTVIELDRSGVPLFSQINQRTENALAEFFGSKNLSDEQLIDSWGKAVKETKNSLSWDLGDNEVLTVYFTDNHYAYNCSIESK